MADIETASVPSGPKIAQGLEGLIQNISPLGNWVEGGIGRTLITGQQLTEDQRQERISTGFECFESGLLSLGTGGLKGVKGPNFVVTPRGGSLSAVNGIDSITGKLPINKPVVVIGESMERVNPVAEQLKQAGFDVKTYNPQNFRSSLGNLNRLDVEANRSWIRYWTQEKEATVIDIGVDPSRAGRSPFYAVENRSIYQNWGYPNVIKYSP